MKKRTLIYDCETARCIPNRHSPPVPGLEYCKGWNDFDGMGISLIGCWWKDAMHFFSSRRFQVFQKIVDEADIIVGFNSAAFDDNLCRANGIDITTNYDLLQEVRVAAGMPAIYAPGITRPGYRLDDLALANLGAGKSGSGELAPVLWQRREKWKLISYLASDLVLTRAIWERRNNLIDPTNGKVLSLR